MRRMLLPVAAALIAGPALADPPEVATDISPVHSLVTRVMQGVGEPALVLPPGASPHGYALRPSEAAALADAGLIVWTGPTLAPWLERAVETLGPGATSLELLGVDGTLLLDYREGAAFKNAHGAVENHDAADAGHEGAPQHEDARGDGQDSEAENDHGPAHGLAGVDPHAWLDPQNAKVWTDAIAQALSAADPDNAATYARNATDARAEIDALLAEIAATLASVRDRPFIVLHDAYHYFEHRFGVEAVGAISLSDASPPGPARVAEIRDVLAGSGAACVFAEPQFASGLVETVTEGSSARTVSLDPLGSQLEPGPDLYPRLIRGIADVLADCLGR